MGDALEVTVDDRLLQRGVGIKFPKFVNQAMNRSYNTFARNFGKFFTKTRLIPGVFDPKRKVNLKKPRRGQPKLPDKMRRAGFIATLSGRNSIKDKELSIRTSSPLLIVREYGDVITPKRKKYLVIRAPKRSVFGASLAFGRRKVARKVRQVIVPPILRFRESFNTFLTTKGMKILEKGLDSAVKRTQKFLDKGKLAA